MYRTIKSPSPYVNTVYFSDCHLTAVPPGRRRDDYAHTILNKLRWVRRLTESLQGAGLCGGDVFHSKNPRSASNPLSLINEIIEVFGSFPSGLVVGVPTIMLTPF